MSKENDILRWYDGEITFEELKKAYPNEDFSTLDKAKFYSKQLEAPKIDAEKAYAEFKERNSTKKKSKVIQLFQPVLKIAAAVALLVTASYFFFEEDEKSFSTEVAQTETLVLPDNSEVTLNAASSLSFNKKTWKDNRSLELDGEAFFKVTKGEKFTVHTKDGKIQVLGTQFNVKRRDNYFEVKCYEGSVKVTSPFGEEVLKPGKVYRVINNKFLSRKNFNIQEINWLAKESTFENTPLWHIINELEIKYDVKISASKVNTTQFITGGFTHLDLEKALKSVTIPLKIGYTIKGKEIEFFNNESK